jgi:hypothetical protein
MPDFAQFIKETDSWKVFLVEMQPCEEVESYSWAQHGVYTNLYYTSYVNGVVSRVTQDGVELLEAYSLVEANATSESFYYDFDAQVLYVHTAGSDDPSTQTAPPEYDYVILAYVWMYFSNTQYSEELVTFPRLTDVLIDGEFEQWNSATEPTHWTAHISGSSTVNRDDTDPEEGAYCVRLDVDGSNSSVYLSRAIRLKPDAHCKLSVWYKHTGSANSVIQIYDSGTNVYLTSGGTWSGSPASITLANSTEWAKYEIEFDADSSYTDYVIILARNSATSESCYFDLARLYFEREQNPYLPYITTQGMADLHQSVSPFYETAMTMEFGSLQFTNDGWWYDKIQTFYWNMKNVRIHFGARESAYDEFEEVFQGMTRTPKATDLLVTIDLIDSKAYTYKSIPEDVYDVATYIWLEDGAEGMSIPIIYGEFEEMVPVCIDITTYVFKIASHAIESVEAVYKNGELMVEDVDYVVDLDEATITFASDPEQAFIVCHIKGRKCSMLDGTYSENVADILYDIMVTYGGIDPAKIDRASFLDLRSARSQKHHLFLDKSEPAYEAVRTLQMSALFHIVPLRNGHIGAFRYTEGLTGDVPVLESQEIDGFAMEYDTASVYSKVRINYGLLPSENHYESIELSNQATKWRHDTENTLDITSSLRLANEANELADYYLGVIKAPMKLVSGRAPSTLFLSYPGSKVIISKQFKAPNGAVQDVLTAAPYRIIDLKKKMSNGKVEIIAWDDLQSSGSTFCENCYSCQLCNVTQSGSCSNCYSCQLCNTGQCTTCQECYYCQACNTGQCTTCQICNTCQVCNACQTTQCASCVTCQSCYTYECSTCESCVSCQECYSCQLCYGGVLP